MKELAEPFKKDRHNLWYLNAGDIKLTGFNFQEPGKVYEHKTKFFKIDEINDYLIKDTTMYPIFFNRFRNINLLKSLQGKQNLFHDIDFPIGYCMDKSKLVGTIIPYYENAISLREFVQLQKLNNLKDLYYRDSSNMDNLIALFLEILDLLSRLYQENVIYLDIHSGNFLLYQNKIKVIDFEPNYVFFGDRNDKYYRILLRNYIIFIETTCKRLGFEDILLNPGETFMETENKVKVLRKKLER